MNNRQQPNVSHLTLTVQYLPFPMPLALPLCIHGMTSRHKCSAIVPLVLVTKFYYVSPVQLKYSNKNWTWTKNQRNSAYKRWLHCWAGYNTHTYTHTPRLILMLSLYIFRYSSANMEGTLSRQQKYDADGFSCSVAPQYWTWGNHMNRRWQLCNLGSLLFTWKRVVG